MNRMTLWLVAALLALQAFPTFAFDLSSVSPAATLTPAQYRASGVATCHAARGGTQCVVGNASTGYMATFNGRGQLVQFLYVESSPAITRADAVRQWGKPVAQQQMGQDYAMLWVSGKWSLLLNMRDGRALYFLTVDKVPESTLAESLAGR